MSAKGRLHILWILLYACNVCECQVGFEPGAVLSMSPYVQYQHPYEMGRLNPQGQIMNVGGSSIMSTFQGINRQFGSNYIPISNSMFPRVGWGGGGDGGGLIAQNRLFNNDVAPVNLRGSSWMAREDPMHLELAPSVSFLNEEDAPDESRYEGEQQNTDARRNEAGDPEGPRGEKLFGEGQKFISLRGEGEIPCVRKVRGQPCETGSLEREEERGRERGREREMEREMERDEMRRSQERLHEQKKAEWRLRGKPSVTVETVEVRLGEEEEGETEDIHQRRLQQVMNELPRRSVPAAQRVRERERRSSANVRTIQRPRLQANSPETPGRFAAERSRARDELLLRPGFADAQLRERYGAPPPSPPSREVSISNILTRIATAEIESNSLGGDRRRLQADLDPYFSGSQFAAFPYPPSWRARQQMERDQEAWERGLQFNLFSGLEHLAPSHEHVNVGNRPREVTTGGRDHPLPSTPPAQALPNNSRGTTLASLEAAVARTTSNRPTRINRPPIVLGSMRQTPNLPLNVQQQNRISASFLITPATPGSPRQTVSYYQPILSPQNNLETGLPFSTTPSRDFNRLFRDLEAAPTEP